METEEQEWITWPPISDRGPTKAKGREVEVRLRNGKTQVMIDPRWSVLNRMDDVVAYRILPKPTAPVLVGDHLVCGAIQSSPGPAQVRLEDCPVGLFLCTGVLGVRTLGQSITGMIHAYDVMTGERFMDNISVSQQRGTYVTPVTIGSANR